MMMNEQRSCEAGQGLRLNQRDATLTRSVRPTTAVTVLASEIASAELCAHAVHCDCCGSSFVHRFTGK
jgi:hypothetical protein